jgi:diadenosine tetraphosphate (Ap4A) HIT family hydrolase
MGHPGAETAFHAGGPVFNADAAVWLAETRGRRFAVHLFALALWEFGGAGGCGDGGEGARAMTSPTLIHAMVERCRAADYPAAVLRLRSGWVIMGERQVLTGYCLLLPDPVVPHLNALPADLRGQFLSDMALVGDALMTVTVATRINYALFGNVEPALHAHIFPRHAEEPEATRSAQPWALDWNAAPSYSEAVHGELRGRIAADIRRRLAVP